MRSQLCRGQKNMMILVAFERKVEIKRAGQLAMDDIIGKSRGSWLHILSKKRISEAGQRNSPDMRNSLI